MRRLAPPGRRGDGRGPEDTEGSAPDSEAPPTLQERLESGYQGPAVPASGADDPAAVISSLEITDCLQRDGWFGRIFHPGEVSFRETRPGNSLHLSVDGNRLLAHVDLVSPLKLEKDRGARYSVVRVAAHNLTGMAGDLVRLLRGRQGDHRCELDAEWSWTRGERGERPVDDGSTVLATAPRPAARLRRRSGPPGPPGNLQLEVGVDGPLDGDRLRRAVADTLGPHWNDDGDALDEVDGDDDEAVSAARTDLQAQVLPLDAAPLRLRLVHRPGGDLVMANLNYAVVDGFAAMQLLRIVAQAYDSGEAPKEPPDLLALHDVPVRPAAGDDTRTVWVYRAAVERVRNLLTPPALLAPDRQESRSGFGYHGATLSVEETRTQVHFEHPGTSTDILLAALHQAIAEWNVGHGHTGGRISVLVSANLRSAQLTAEALGNFSVTARVSTSRRHRRSPAATLAAVRSQTSRNRRRRTGVALLEALDRLGLLALWARQSVIVLDPVSVNRNVDSAMLCNLGRLVDPPCFGAGGGSAAEVWFSPPTRIPVGLSIGAATVAGRLHLVFRYPQRLFDDDAARRFANCYLHQLRRLAPPA